MDANMAGEDASLDAAVALITKKIAPEDVGLKPERQREDKRENRADRDHIEQDDYQDLEALEAAEREEKRAKTGDKPDETTGDAEGEEGQEAEAEDDAFIELPPAEEGKAPERVAIKEAVEAVQKLRQLDGDIQAAVIRAEEDAFQKQDHITKAFQQTFETVAQQARASLEVMHRYLPQAPDPIMLDENSGYYNPAEYHRAKIYYDGFVQHYRQVEATLKNAQTGLSATSSTQDQETVRRENERTARYIPEWKEEKARDAKKQEIVNVLGPKYGLKIEDVNEIADHRAIRILADLAKTMQQTKAAPEVRKHLQETKPKLVKGRLPDRETGTGRFVASDRKELKESGSEDAFARYLLRSGALKGL